MRTALIAILLLVSTCASAETGKSKAEPLASFGKWIVFKRATGACIAIYGKNINIHMHHDDLVIINKEGVKLYDYRLDDSAPITKQAAKVERDFSIVRFANDDLKVALAAKKISIEIINDMSLTDYYDIDLTEAWIANSYLNSEHCS